MAVYLLLYSTRKRPEKFHAVPLQASAQNLRTDNLKLTTGFIFGPVYLQPSSNRFVFNPGFIL